MTAAAVVSEAKRRGVRLWLAGGRLFAEGPRAEALALRDQIARNRDAIRALLAEEAPASAGDRAIAAANLLREGRWPAEAAPCRFFIGEPVVACRRCGASWTEHFAR